MTALEVIGVSAGYGANRVLDGVSFRARSGQCVAIVGPNGAGKSTLLKVILGLQPASRGTIQLDGRSLAAQAARVAYVPQRADIDWDYPATTAELVAMGRTPWHGAGWLMAPRRRAAQALARVGLEEKADCPIGELSGGQRQRALLARALHRGAEVIVLDEPMAAVDRASEAVIWGELERLCRGGALVVMVHHDLEAARTRSNACLLLGHGCAVYGPPDHVLASRALDRAYNLRPVQVDETDGRLAASLRRAA